jgi:long-chain acyl-CoA synthetase
VIGVKDEKSGEAPKAFVVRKDPNLTSGDIIKFARTELTSYKVPRQIEFRDSLPKSNVGKILRHQLRQESKAASPHERAEVSRVSLPRVAR